MEELKSSAYILIFGGGTLLYPYHRHPKNWVGGAGIYRVEQGYIGGVRDK